MTYLQKKLKIILSNWKMPTKTWTKWNDYEEFNNLEWIDESPIYHNHNNTHKEIINNRMD